MKYCSHCGAQLSDGQAYCPSCGTPAENQNQNARWRHHASIASEHRKRRSLFGRAILHELAKQGDSLHRQSAISWKQLVSYIFLIAGRNCILWLISFHFLVKIIFVS